MPHSRPEETWLLRYVSGKCSPEEREAVERWMTQSDENERFVAELEQIWNADWDLPVQPFADVAEQDWRTLQAQLRQAGRQERKPRRRRQRTRRSHMSRVVAGVSIAAIVLILGIALLINERAGMSASDETAHRIITTEPGQRLAITLGDGTYIELNAASRLVIPELFEPDERVVQLEGEAFFDVITNDAAFVVETPDTRVRVLGTSFGVRAYPDERLVELGVSSGMIAFGSSFESSGQVVLRAGDTALFDRESREAQSADLDVAAFLAWRDGQVSYQAASLGYVARDLSRRYGTQVVVDVEDPGAYAITARLQARVLSDVAAAITAPIGLRSEVTDEGIRIYE